jgi:hypothetical protein
MGIKAFWRSRIVQQALETVSLEEIIGVDDVIIVDFAAVFFNELLKVADDYCKSKFYCEGIPQ